jgi:hypothetical protein
MWTRPDAFVIGGALLISRVALRSQTDDAGKVPWARLIRGVVLGGLLYVPWFAWAWWYYGTPVPHTIIAKSAYTAPVHALNLLLLPWFTLTGKSMLVDLFLPTYWSFGGWPSLLPNVAHLLTGIAAFAWLVRPISPTARRASLTIFIGMFYVCSILLFPWYVPPWTVMASIAVGVLVDGLYANAIAVGRRSLALVCRIGCVVILGIQAAVLVAAAWQMRIEQRLVEDGVRRSLGEWLQQNSRPGDTVFLEPLGYIGYFSQLRTYDFPGLSSPEVVSVVRSGGRRYADVIARLRPSWVVLRPGEFQRPEFAATRVLQDYEFVRAWDALSQLDQAEFLPGRGWIEGESRFMLFRRKAATASPAPAK